MTEPKFKIGDVVRLRSGGPAMTVGDCRGSIYACTWFKPDGEPCSRNFDEATLTEHPGGGYDEIPWPSNG